jgi:hypothetical protein
LAWRGAVAERLHWFWGLRDLDLGRRRRGEALRDAALLEHHHRGLLDCRDARRFGRVLPKPISDRRAVLVRGSEGADDGHQPTGRVIDEHEQRALGAAILKPPMLAAVDLDQLADAVASGARLMDALSPLLAFAPQPGLDPPQPPGLASERYSINLTQLLAFETLLEALSALVFRYSGRRMTSR